MTLTFSSRAWSDYLEWADEAGTRQGAKMLARVNRLIEEASRTPSEGIGKPEPLRGQLSGCWSRRITDEHRLVYRHTNAGVEIIACRQRPLMGAATKHQSKFSTGAWKVHRNPLQ